MYSLEVKGKNVFLANNKLFSDDLKISLFMHTHKMYDELATAAESAAESKDLRVLYDIARKLPGKRYNRVRPIKAQNGNMLTSTEEQI